MSRFLLWLIRALKLEKLDRFFGAIKNKPRQVLISFFSWLGMLGTVFTLIIGVAVLGIVWRINTDLPSHEHLANYEPAVMTRVYSSDGTLLAEYADQYRLFVPFQEVPPQLINALVATEDKSYWTHPGLDAQGILRASLMNVSRIFTGERLVGGSTITQQVARNFLLTHRVRLERKIKEALLALRIERALSKEKIMELYVNQIYLGLRSWGIASAALHYFGKALNELSLSEMAYLAALPKGPNNYHPVRRKQAATDRRNWVLKRMAEEGYISEEQRRIAAAENIYPPPNPKSIDKRWAYFSEDVRRTLKKMFGDKPLYKGGLIVHTTLNTKMQKAAYDALRNGLSAYDRRHGWRGIIRKLPLSAYWPAALAKMNPPKDIDPWRLAIVLKVLKTGAKIGLRPDHDGYKTQGQSLLATQTGFIPLKEMTWAREQYADYNLGRPIKHPSQVLEKGDVIYVEPLTQQAARNASAPKAKLYSLRQLPQVNGAIIAMNPHSGRVLAMTGGFSFAINQFNRATQAMRQPGSAIKPFIYAAALDNGFTPISKVLDTPFVSNRGEEFLWKPSNYGRAFSGPTVLRKGLELSRNLMTVHLANEIGLRPVMDYTKRFGIAVDVRPELGLALGIEETSLIKLTAAYGMLANGGKHITPFTIERIQDRLGRTIYKNDLRSCKNCNVEIWRGGEPPLLSNRRSEVISPQTVYQIISMLQGVVKRGTGVRARVKGMTIAGKTGTTNKERDAWFVGFSPDLVVGVYVGFDLPKPMGRKETGGRVAAPIFADFMRRIKLGLAKPFHMPPGITLVRINRNTGEPASNNDRNTIWEAFKTGTEPSIVRNSSQVINRNENPEENTEQQQDAITSKSQNKEDDFSGTGGLY